MKTIFIWLYLSLGATACGQTSNSAIDNSPSTSPAQTNEPPTCTCCVFAEASKPLKHQVKIAADTATGQRIIIRGTVYQSDGKTPAPDVLMYFYHTDHSGHYSKHGNEDKNSFAWWHGYTRGFLKTNANGEYEINTIKPQPYPARTDPAHIHCIVKSPGQKQCYYIADFVFSDDELLTPDYWKATAAYWASIGIDDTPDYGGITLKKMTAIWEGKRDIVLFNEYDLPGIQSGNPIGSESPAFSPQHVAGPDKGSRACPMCKYGYYPGVLLFVNTDEDWKNIALISKKLEEESIKRKSQQFKAYLIYTNPSQLTPEEIERKLKHFADSLSIRNMAVTYVPSVADTKTEMNLNNINPKTKTTIIVYNNRTVFDKFVDFIPTDKNFKLLFNSVEEAGKLKALLPGKKEQFKN